MQRRVSRGWRQHNRKRHFRSQDLGVRLNGADIRDSLRNQIDPAKRFTIPAQSELTLSAVRSVVVDLAWLFGVKNSLEIESIDHFVDAGHAAVIAKGILLGLQQRRRRSHAQSAEYPAPRGRVEGIHRLGSS